jgi:hypothetical protein
MTITSLGYERGYLEWGIAYLFPWKGQTKLRFNLNNPSFREDRKHYRHYIGNISHEEIDCLIYEFSGKEGWKGWHNLMMGYVRRVPKRIEHPFSYNGFLTENALLHLKPKRLYRHRRKGR